MEFLHTATIYDDTFDLATTSSKDVHFAFVVGLPFRIRVKSPYHLRFENQGNEYDIWIRNKPIEWEQRGDRRPSMIQPSRNVEDYWSTVAVIPCNSKVTDAELGVIQRSLGNGEEVNLESRVKYRFPVMQALNAFIIGYHTATGELFGGRTLQSLTVSEFIDRKTWEITLIGMPLENWNEGNIDELFDFKTERNIRISYTLSGEMSDLAEDRLAGIGQAIDRLNSFYFYELAFEAKTKMASSDYRGALLMAVAALEGAHGAFVSHALGARLPTNRTREDKKLEDEFIKELGFSLCNKLTPYLFMEPVERPSPDLLRRAARAITFRNDIMHALRKPTGEYKIRTRTNLELSDAYSAALQLYELYRRAFEKATSPDGTSTNVDSSSSTPVTQSMESTTSSLDIDPSERTDIIEAD
jgi:hypothetical protein